MRGGRPVERGARTVVTRPRRGGIAARSPVSSRAARTVIAAASTPVMVGRVRQQRSTRARTAVRAVADGDPRENASTCQPARDGVEHGAIVADLSYDARMDVLDGDRRRGCAGAASPVPRPRRPPRHHLRAGRRPGPVGAGITLQPTASGLLARLGLLAPIAPAARASITCIA
jgi:hypothetical protein